MVIYGVDIRFWPNLCTQHDTNADKYHILHICDTSTHTHIHTCMNEYTRLPGLSGAATAAQPVCGSVPMGGPSPAADSAACHGAGAYIFAANCVFLEALFLHLVHFTRAQLQCCDQ